MKLEELKRNLNYIKKKHQNDKLFTGDTNIKLLCEDCLNAIADMEAEIAQLREENWKLKMKICQPQQYTSCKKL